MSKFFSKVTSVIVLSLLLALGVQAATIEVISSGAFYATMEELKPAFEEKQDTQSTSNQVRPWALQQPPSPIV